MIHFIYDGKSFVKLSDNDLIDPQIGFEGIFETMSVCNGEIFLLKDHLERFYRGAKKLKVKTFSAIKLKKALDELIGKYNDIKIVRFIAVKETEPKMIFSISDKKRYEDIQYEKGFSLSVAVIDKEDVCSADSSIKHLSLMKLSKFRELAKEKGFNDCLILKNGFISDTSVANVFWVKDNAVFTPSAQKCLLEGATRNFAIELLQRNDSNVVQGSFTPKEILNADEIFITNSLMGIMPVTGITLKNKKLLKFEAGKKTKYLMNIFDFKHFYS